jgi:hypothetical protein
MKIDIYLHLLITILLIIVYHNFLSSNDSVNHHVIAYGQNQEFFISSGGLGFG